MDAGVGRAPRLVRFSRQTQPVRLARTILDATSRPPPPCRRLFSGRRGPRCRPAARRCHLRPVRTPDVELELIAAPATVSLLPGAPTNVWRFTGRILRGARTTAQTIDESYLGPVIRVRRGQRVRIHFRNQLGEPSIVHWHGLDVPELADGHPRLAVGHGGEYGYDFDVTNRAGTSWYHPQPHMRPAAQVYQGMAGLLLVSDPEEDALGLSSGDGELLCVVRPTGSGGHLHNGRARRLGR